MAIKNENKQRENEAVKSKAFPVKAFLTAFFSGLCMLICVLLYVLCITDIIPLTPEQALATVTALVTAFAAAVVITALISTRKAAKAAEKENKEKAAHQRFPLGLFHELYQPVAVCDENGTLMWGNGRFCDRATNKNILLNITPISSLFKFQDFELSDPTLTPPTVKASAREIFDFISASEATLVAKGDRSFGGGDWLIRAYPYSSNETSYFLLVFSEITELNEWKKNYADNRTVCAYVVIDNLEELVSKEQESYRQASAEVDSIIKTWAAENQAIVKEYERDKYIVIFRDYMLHRLLDAEFDILERVRKIKIGSEQLSVTVSIGVSEPDGELDKKEHSAQSALETALQRGGNQAVINTADGQIYFGAKSITSPKRSSVHHRVFAERLVHAMKESSNVIIMGHRNADFDAIGSCAGIARLAYSLDKPVNIVVNRKDPTIQDALNKLLEISEYENAFTDAISGQELLSGTPLVICCDVNNTKQFEAPDIVANADRLFIIDHHRQHESTPQAVPGQCEILIVPSASSASELVAEILELELPQDCRLNHHEADLMFAGILLDTKQFTRNTLAPTFSAALYLRNSGADPAAAQALFKTELEDFRRESEFGTDLILEREFIAIARETGDDSSSAKRIAAAKTADRLLNIKNIRVSFVLARMSNDVFISARSDGSVNVQLIMETLGGGGHYNAAATLMKETSVDQAMDALRKAIEQYFGDNRTSQPFIKKPQKIKKKIKKDKPARAEHHGIKKPPQRNAATTAAAADAAAPSGATDNTEAASDSASADGGAKA